MNRLRGWSVIGMVGPRPPVQASTGRRGRRGGFEGFFIATAIGATGSEHSMLAKDGRPDHRIAVHLIG